MPAPLWWLVGVALVAVVALEAKGQSSAKGRRVWADSALAVATVDSAWSRVHATYYDTTFRGNDWVDVRREARERAARARDMGEVRAAIRGMFDLLGESHFALMAEDAVGSWSAPSPGDRAPGDVGVEFRLVERDVVVSRVVAGSPADRAGVKPGWTLERVENLDVAGFVRERLDGANARLRRLAEVQVPLSLLARVRGDSGTMVRVELRDGRGRQRSALLVRRRADGEVVRFGHLPPQLVRVERERIDDARGCVGVLRFNVWMLPVMPRVDEAMVAFRECRGVVLDLRGNVGGVAAMVMGMGGYFLDSAASLGTMTTRTGALRYVANPRRSDRDGHALLPFGGALAILVDPVSASTSEIFAAGLQALGRARVFGEPSAGQALPAMLAKLPNGDVMQYVVADFVAPDGRRLEARGVVPDELVPLRRRALLAGRDEPMRSALAWIDSRPALVAVPAGTSGR